MTGAPSTTAVYPYESQWGDLRCNEPVIVRGERPGRFHDWATDGYATEEEYEYWAAHVCGLAGFRSVLRAWRPEARVVPMRQLIAGAVEAGALVPRDDTVDGLYYRPFLAWIARDFGIDGDVFEHARVADWAPGIGDGAVVLASVSPEIRWPDRPNHRRGGHLVLVHARDADGRLIFHNPSGIGRTAAGAVAEPAVFERFHAGRGIRLRR
ncbi:hypothetical protein IT072_11785 [Leifsonia sp. ZF2019]|uniref:hypothetical protein n=1 Tax=Leifsonia sp. ZF2019 TaxID=2781978 RepID=UPI001CBE5849|nr:hypothetical protein [Leifsonia sp. ZF2019]UAJ77973.1 hypothetical protein IT072_11785 [Leifsonia sp. ZF2019]